MTSARDGQISTRIYWEGSGTRLLVGEGMLVVAKSFMTEETEFCLCVHFLELPWDDVSVQLPRKGGVLEEQLTMHKFLSANPDAHEYEPSRQPPLTLQPRNPVISSWEGKVFT